MNTMELTPEELNLLKRFHMGNGLGDYEQGNACVMACAVALWRFRHGEELGEATDELDCVCPVLRRLAIRLNDGVWWPAGEAERTAVLIPMVPRLLGTNNPGKTRLRMYRAADWSVRTMLPTRLRARGKVDEASALEACAPITDKA